MNSELWRWGGRRRGSLSAFIDGYKQIVAYALASVLSAMIDFLVFSIGIWSGYGIWRSTVMARLAAACVNFSLNRNVIFKAREKIVGQMCKYALLLVGSGSISAFTISYFKVSHSANLIITKAIVEICLFFLNYYIQKAFIFVKQKSDEIEKGIFTDDITEKTDWTKYYGEKKSWVSTVTQKYTLQSILAAIDGTFEKEKAIRICELGGGNSCFCVKVCEKKKVETYDIIDNNRLAVKLFEKLEMMAIKHKGICQDLLNDDIYGTPRYDFVYSIGLIEHFRGDDIRIMIRRHFEYCKDGGIVFIAFPTPTKKYLLVRKCMEFLGVWKFYDEKPICYEDIADCFEEYGTVLKNYINSKLLLTQKVVMIKKEKVFADVCQD